MMKHTPFLFLVLIVLQKSILKILLLLFIRLFFSSKTETFIAKLKKIFQTSQVLEKQLGILFHLFMKQNGTNSWLIATTAITRLLDNVF